MAISVSFYNNKSSAETVNKTKALIATYNCEIYDEENIENPTLLIENNTNLKNCNYCYIPTYGRYYFCTPIMLPDGRHALVGTTDVLSSFWSDCKDFTQVIACRSSSNYNAEIEDNQILKLKSEDRRYVNMNQNQNSVFTNDRSKRSVVLTLQGV